MSTAFSLPIWVARCCGNKTNCLYSDFHTATDVETLKKLVANDHTFICFKNNYRDEKNFKYKDTLVTDCDNTHSDDPKDWITKDAIIDEFRDVSMLIYTSRNHMKPKDGKAPRPKYHIVFFIERITSPEEYKRLIKRVQEFFPYFDTKAQDAARFFYGNPDAEIYVQAGILNLSMFFDEDAFAHMDQEIHEGSRNATMFRWAVRSMKRYGNTEESRKFFIGRRKDATHRSMTKSFRPYGAARTSTTSGLPRSRTISPRRYITQKARYAGKIPFHSADTPWRGSLLKLCLMISPTM